MLNMNPGGLMPGAGGNGPTSGGFQGPRRLPFAGWGGQTTATGQNAPTPGPMAGGLAGLGGGMPSPTMGQPQAPQAPLFQPQPSSMPTAAGQMPQQPAMQPPPMSPGMWGGMPNGFGQPNPQLAQALFRAPRGTPARWTGQTA